MVNLQALPDKGERLRTQVKELEQALESLSLTAAGQPGNVGVHSIQFFLFFFLPQLPNN